MRFDLRNRNSDLTIGLKQELEFRKSDYLRYLDFRIIIAINKKTFSMYVQNLNLNFVSTLLSKKHIFDKIDETEQAFYKKMVKFQFKFQIPILIPEVENDFWKQDFRSHFLL